MRFGKVPISLHFVITPEAANLVAVFKCLDHSAPVEILRPTALHLTDDAVCPIVRNIQHVHSLPISAQQSNVSNRVKANCLVLVSLARSKNSRSDSIAMLNQDCFDWPLSVRVLAGSRVWVERAIIRWMFRAPRGH